MSGISSLSCGRPRERDGSPDTCRAEHFHSRSPRPLRMRSVKRCHTFARHRNQRPEKPPVIAPRTAAKTASSVLKLPFITWEPKMRATNPAAPRAAPTDAAPSFVVSTGRQRPMISPAAPPNAIYAPNSSTNVAPSRTIVLAPLVMSTRNAGTKQSAVMDNVHPRPQRRSARMFRTTLYLINRGNTPNNRILVCCMHLDTSRQ